MNIIIAGLIIFFLVYFILPIGVSIWILCRMYRRMRKCSSHTEAMATLVGMIVGYLLGRQL